MLRHILLFLHLAGVVVWVGGMFFAYFCLRPAAARLLEPPSRIGLWIAVLDPFFRFVAVAVGLILLSGFAILAQSDLRTAPLGWYVMLSLGLTMTGIFAYIDRVLYPRLRRHCQSAAWPAAGAALNNIRQLVAANLVLAVCTIAAAIFSR